MDLRAVRAASTPPPDDTKDAAKDAAPLRLKLSNSDVSTFSLVALLIIVVVAVLYVAKAFFLPVVTAFIVGTMLAPAASFFEKRNIPRSLSAVLIVVFACAGVAFMIGLISSPLIEWSSRLPELGDILKEKMRIFEKPLALWRQMQGTLGETDTLSKTSFQLPDIEWFKPTMEFLSPTLTEILLFVATLILFIASWKDLRRKLAMMSPDRDRRLQALKTLRQLEGRLGSYLLMVTLINLGVGAAAGIICALSGMPNPAGLGSLAAILNFFPIIGPVVMFVVLLVVGLVSFSSITAGLIAPLAFAVLTFVEGHFVTPAIVGRRLQLNALVVFIALAFWTWLWGPMGGFLSSPLLIIGLILKEHLMPDTSPQLPAD